MKYFNVHFKKSCRIIRNSYRKYFNPQEFYLPLGILLTHRNFLYPQDFFYTLRIYLILQDFIFLQEKRNPLELLLSCGILSFSCRIFSFPTGFLFFLQEFFFPAGIFTFQGVYLTCQVRLTNKNIEKILHYSRAILWCSQFFLIVQLKRARKCSQENCIIKRDSVNSFSCKV